MNGGDTVPCGYCYVCKKKHLDGWLFRLSVELGVSDNAYFCTFTYNDEHLKPLNKRDMQLFFKRLRKAHEKTPYKGRLKYFLVGEHGKKTKRPHYHAIIFNADYQLIKKVYNYGFSDIQVLKGVSGISYTLKYIHKVEKKERFTMMSKNLGKSYLTPSVVKFHRSAPQNSFVVFNGYRKQLPKYYKERIYDEKERKAVTSYLHSKFNHYYDKEILKLSKLFPQVSDVRTLFELRQSSRTFPYRVASKISNKESLIKYLSKNVKKEMLI